MGQSVAEQISALPAAEQSAYDDVLGRPGIQWDPAFWLRTEQLDALHSETWLTLLLAGRGAGKTRVLSEWVRDKAKTPGTRIALVARTVADVRDTMVNGQSGILQVCPPDEKPEYVPSARTLRWPNGSVALTFSAEKADQLRGPQFNYAACDELACLPGDTMIRTSTGEKPIKDVQVGEGVWTRGGWQPVLWSGPTRPDAELVELVTEDGDVLRCTPDHRIWDHASSTWVFAEDMLGGRVVVCRSSEPSVSSGMVGAGTRTGRTGTTTTERVGSFTSPSTGSSSVTSPVASSSTTLTRTEGTTSLRTSPSCRQVNTSVITASAGSLPTPPRFDQRSAGLRGADVSRLRRCAPSAKTPSSPPGCVPSSAPPGASLSTSLVVTIRTVPEREQTYDLTVAHFPEFLADGILVHNSWRMLPDSSGLNAWDNLQIATRLGKSPQIMVATTPKRVPILRQLVERAKTDTGLIHILRGATSDNIGNLSSAYIELIYGMYAGTSIARQELFGELLDEVDGALWNTAMLDENRIEGVPGDIFSRKYVRVVGVDPSVSAKPGDECGIIIAAGTKGPQFKREALVIDDRSLQGSPEEWTKVVVQAAKRWQAIVVAEQNQGGDLVRMAIQQHDPSIPVVLVSATKGKAQRAEPVVMAYEQGRVKHAGVHGLLEDEMTSWVPGESGYSPNRLDALVWAMSGLLGSGGDKLRTQIGEVRVSRPSVARSLPGVIPGFRAGRSNDRRWSPSARRP